MKKVRVTVLFTAAMLAMTVMTGCGKHKNVTEQETQGVQTAQNQQKEPEEYLGSDYLGVDELEEKFAKVEIVIPELENEYEFLFLTDTHLVTVDENEAEQVKEYTETRYKLFYEQNYTSSMERFDDWIQYANQEKLSGVLFGGDIIDFPSKANLNVLREELSQLEVPYIYTLGNHDWTYPWEYMTASGNEYREDLEPYMKENTRVHSLEFDEFIIVALDNSNNQFSSDCVEELQEYMEMDKPLILLIHVPLLTQSALTKAKETWKNGVILGGGNYGGIYPDENSAKIIEMINAKDSPVAAVLAGHVHFFDKDMINEKVVQIIGGPGYAGVGTLIRITGSSD